MLRHRPRERLARRRSQVPWVRRIPLRPPPVVGNVPTFIDIRGGRRGVRVKGRRKDKGVAILDYALGNRPSTGGEVGGRLCPTRPAPVGSSGGGSVRQPPPRTGASIAQPGHDRSIERGSPLSHGPSRQIPPGSISHCR